jgi:hypothetical protein
MKRTALLLLALASLATALDFVHLTDTHVTDQRGALPAIATARWHLRDSHFNLEHVLDRFNGPSAPAFLLITGDLIDAYSIEGAGPQIDFFRKAVERARTPLFLVLGNHDLTRFGKAGSPLVADEARAAWRQAFPVFKDGTYYAFRKQEGRTNYLFLALDNGQSADVNPAYAARQIAWLKEQIAARPRDTVILAMHIPLGRDAFSVLLKEAVAGTPSVVLALAGHRHTNAIEDIDLGARRLTQVRTGGLFLDEANWRLIRLMEDRIEVFAPGQSTEVARRIPPAQP